MNIVFWLFLICSWFCLVWSDCYEPENDHEIIYPCSHILDKNNTACNYYGAPCDKWCNGLMSIGLTGVKMQIIHDNNGTVEFSFDPSPQFCCYTHYKLELLTKTDNNSERQSHTSKTISITSDSSYNCSQIISVKFSYVFSGLYQLAVQPNQDSNSRKKCYSVWFNISTGYHVKNAIEPVSPLVTFDYNKKLKKLAIKLNTTNFLIDTFIFMVEHTFCNDQVMGTEKCCTYSLHRRHKDKTNSQHISFNEKNNCSCYWQKVLHCDFYNIDPGNYCLGIMANDIRCNGDNVWNNYGSCLWNIDIVLLPFLDYTDYSEDASMQNNSVETILYLIFGTLIMVSIIYILTKKRRVKWNHIEDTIDSKRTTENLLDKSIGSENEVLLLYPRDCQPFMESMECFRTLLSNIPNLKVYDLWSPEIIEKIAQEDLRIVNLLAKNVKVILLATPCSRKFEKAYHESSRISYLQPTYFDNMFPDTLNYIFHMDNLYSKVFVVRLDGPDFQENIFKFISQGIVYTIPQQFDAIVSSLLGLNPNETKVNYHFEITKYFDALKERISAYYKYQEQNPNYLNDLFSNSDWSS